MRRRDFINAISGSAIAWPLGARAQTPAGKVYRLDFLQPGKPPEPLVDIFQERLKELGYREGHNIAYEYRWAEGIPDRLVGLAKERERHRLHRRCLQSDAGGQPFALHSRL